MKKVVHRVTKSASKLKQVNKVKERRVCDWVEVEKIVIYD